MLKILEQEKLALKSCRGVTGYERQEMRYDGKL